MARKKRPHKSKRQPQVGATRPAAHPATRRQGARAVRSASASDGDRGPAAAFKLPQSWPWIAAGLLMLAFALIKLAHLVPGESDENIYFYAGWKVTQGAQPYRDFFFAHPPLQIYLLGLLIATFGFGVTMAKLTSLAFALGAATLCFALMKPRLGPAAALCGLAAGMFGYNFIRASSFCYGIEMAHLLLLGAMLAFTRGRLRLAGALVALTLLTRVNALPGVAAFGLAAFLFRPRDTLKLVGYSAAVLGPALLLLYLVFGQAFIDSVFLYHFRKPPEEGNHEKMFSILWWHDSALLLSAGLGVILAGGLRLWSAIQARRPASAPPPPEPEAPSFWRRWWAQDFGDGDLVPVFCVASLALHGAMWLIINRMFAYYFVAIQLEFGILVGYGVAGCLALARKLEPPRRYWLAAGLAMLWMAPLTFNPHRPGPPTQTHRYRINDIRVLSELFMSLFYQATEYRDATYTSLKRFGWSAQQHAFFNAPQVARWIHERSSPGDTILGDSMPIGMVALLSGRAIVGDLVDLNPMRFRAGLPSMTEALKTIDDPSLKFLFLYPSPRGDLFQFPEFREFVAKKFTRAERFGPYWVYQRNE